MHYLRYTKTGDEQVYVVIERVLTGKYLVGTAAIFSFVLNEVT